MATTHVVSVNETTADSTTGDVVVPIYQRKTILTDAQIKALPNTPVEVLPAQPGKIVIFHKAVLYRNEFEGNYGNIEEGSLNLKQAGAPIAIGPYNDTDTVDSLTWLLAPGLGVPPAFQVIQQEAPATLNGFSVPRNGYVSEGSAAIVLDGGSFDGGNYTGGHANNTLGVTVFYSIVDL
jgi:hypothetical protein